MKKVIATTVLILGLSAGLSAPQVMAAPEAGLQASQASAEKS